MPLKDYQQTEATISMTTPTPATPEQQSTAIVNSIVFSKPPLVAPLLPLKYHNPGHADLMVISLFTYWSEALGKGTLDSMACERISLAAHFHDCVYVPGASKFFTPSNVNEKLSAEVFLRAYKSSVPKDLWDAVDYLKVAEMIEATWFENHLSPDYVPPCEETAVLLDIDLQSLGSSYKNFVLTQSYILSEHLVPQTDPTAAQQLAQSDFLEQFLKKKYIFHTETARALWEDQARQNIRQFTADARSL